MGFSRKEYWSGLPFPCPGDLPNPGLALDKMRMVIMLVTRKHECCFLKLSVKPALCNCNVLKLRWSWVSVLVTHSCPTLSIPWTVGHQVPLSMGFSRQEYWSWLPFPSPGELPDPGIQPWSLTLQADSLPSEPPGKPKYHALSSKTLLYIGNIVQNSYYKNCSWHFWFYIKEWFCNIFGSNLLMENQ